MASKDQSQPQTQQPAQQQQKQQQQQRGGQQQQRGGQQQQRGGQQQAQAGGAQESNRPAPLPKEKGRGYVKSVLSATSLLVVVDSGKPLTGPPVEREINFSGLQAPRLGRLPGPPRSGPGEKEREEADQEFAWPAREFLRKLAIGKMVTFTIDNSRPGQEKSAEKTRDYGTVYLIRSAEVQENLSKLVVSEGWATVKVPDNGREPRAELAELIEAEKEAKERKRGRWNDVEGAAAATVRAANRSSAFDIFTLYKGKTVTGIVENVQSGSTLRVLLLPSFANLRIYLSGVQCPMPPRVGDSTPPKPFSREARFFTENHLLQREVEVVLEGIDKQENFYASVALGTRNLSEELLKLGYAEYVQWSACRSPHDAKLRAALQTARDAKLRLYANYNPEEAAAAPAAPTAASIAAAAAAAAPVEPAAAAAPVVATGAAKYPPPSGKLGVDSTPRVTEVLNATAIKVSDNNVTDYLVTLSSIAIPRAKREKLAAGAAPKKENLEKAEAAAKAWAWEGREFLRKQLIGKKVSVHLDYAREAIKKPGQSDLPRKDFYTVRLENANVAVALVEQGFAEVIYHRDNDPRSCDYESLLIAEKSAQAKSRGLHGSDEKAPIHHINDLSLPNDASPQAKLEAAAVGKRLNPHLKRAGRMHGVIEYVFNAARVKVYVPKENCMFVLSLSGIRVPRPNGEGANPAVANKALLFAKEKVLQREVEVDVIGDVDKSGAMIGNVWINKKSLACLLLELGFASIMTFSAQELDNYNEMLTCQSLAQKARRAIWKDYDEAVEEEKRKTAQEERRKREEGGATKELLDVVVTEVIDGANFYVQVIGKGTTDLEALMADLNADETAEPVTPKVNELVRAKFSQDDAWYRAKVIEIAADKAHYKVLYADYGNSEMVPAANVRQLNAATFGVQRLPLQASEAQLAYVVPPALDDDFGEDAADYLRELSLGKQLTANVEYRDGSKLFLTLLDAEGQLVNAALLRAGLVSVEKFRGRVPPIVKKLQSEQDDAKKNRACIWQYGDIGADDDDRI